MHQRYLDVTQQGKNQWWRYVLGVIVAQFFFQVVSIIVLLLLLQGLSIASPNIVNWIPRSIAAYGFVNFPFIFFALGTLLAVKWLHHRPILTLISADRTFRLERFWAGFCVWFSMLTLSQIMLIWLTPNSYRFSLEPLHWLVFLPFALVLTPIQTTAEELFFRGYLMQGFGLVNRHPLFLIGATSFLFLLPHLGNPELQRGVIWVGLSYWVWGVFFAAITLKDDRLELSMGSHAANNLFAALMINSADSVLPSPAIWSVEPGDPRISLIYQLALSALFYYLFFGLGRSAAPRSPKDKM